MELTVEHLNKVYTKHGNQNHVYKDYPGLVTSWSNYAMFDSSCRFLVMSGLAYYVDTKK